MKNCPICQNKLVQAISHQYCQGKSDHAYSRDDYDEKIYITLYPSSIKSIETSVYIHIFPKSNFSKLMYKNHIKDISFLLDVNCSADKLINKIKQIFLFS